jgi:hypothetical protein
LGFSLFSEVQYLLRNGQPPSNAHYPSLELHVDLLRTIILSFKIALIEVPPVPSGFELMVCLTHDVDHVGIKNHRFDHTLTGFLFRATLGSVLHVFQNRKSCSQLWANWKAAFSLPFIHLGLAPDFWYQFDHYCEIERNLGSTFFIIPKKNEPGLDACGIPQARRAAKYDVADIRPQLLKLRSLGVEVGVHGLDAWRDGNKGKEEAQIISRLLGETGQGVRMHWLYFSEASYQILEDAGFPYDSTVGYNETIGFRAGTMQVFRPLGMQRLMELPMHIMDTALFYPSYLNLKPDEAWLRVKAMIMENRRFGGVLCFNWHDRSIAPERLWNEFYQEVLVELKSQAAWFATASQAIAWFQMRRSIKFQRVMQKNGDTTWEVTFKADPSVPGMRLRRHRWPSDHNEIGYNDVVLDKSTEVIIAA